MNKFSFLLPFLLFCSLSASAQFQLNGNASSLGNNCFQVTPAATSQRGSVWATQTISLNQSFTFYFQMQFGCSDGGADGIAFLLQQTGPSAIGTLGGGMGYNGISPSLVIEFDTYHNSSSGDITADHIGILQNGSNDHFSTNSLAGPVAISPTGANVEDCQFHDIHIVWNHTSNTLEVYYNCSLRLTYTGNIVSNIFSNNPDVFFGFTAGTGALTNDHRVCVEYVPGASRLSDEGICQGGMVTADASPGNAFNWTPTTGVSNPMSAMPTLTPDTTTTYQVTVTDVCGFSWSDSMLVDVATIDAGPNQLIGFGQSVMLNSTYNGPPSVGNCNAYTSTPITYAPLSLNSPTSISLANAATDFSGAIPLGFNFDFFCTSFSQCYFSTGGYLTFDNGTTNTTPTTIPSTLNPNNIIAYCWSSLDLMTIQYETQGTAPNRRFVADISGTHWFSNVVSPPGAFVDVQLVLHEAGEVEMFIDGIAASWFSTMTQGVEGNGSSGTFIAGRNNVMNWTANTEAYRFEPMPAVVNYTWMPNTNINNNSLEDPTVNPTVDTWYYVTFDDGNCLLTDSVFVMITPLAIDILSFKALSQDASIDLLWSIDQAPRGGHWLLEQSHDGQNFHSFAEIEFSQRVWTLPATQIRQGVNYFRLRLFDETGVELAQAITTYTQQFHHIQISPNPTQDYLQVQTPKLFEKSSWSIFDVFGKNVLAGNFLLSSTGKYELDVSTLAEGIYFFQLTLDEEIFEEKLIKK